MPRRTHFARLQRMERALGICECRRARVLICTKAIEAHECGELATEPCPAGCAPETRLVVAIRMSAWRNDDECACPACDPLRQRRPSVPEPVAEPRALPQPAQDALEGQPEAQDAPAPAAGVPAGLLEAAAEPPASKQVVEVRHRVSVPLGAPPPQPGPEDVVGGPEPYGDCAIPWCGHPLRAHRSWTESLPCRYCGWPVTAHEGFDPALVFGLPYAARRAMACAVYIAIRFEGGEHDGCAVSGCACPGWRRNAPWISARESALQAQIEVRDRIIAANEEKLARLQDEYEARQRALLRAQGQINNGPSPHGAPVYVEGASK